MDEHGDVRFHLLDQLLQCSDLLLVLRVLAVDEPFLIVSCARLLIGRTVLCRAAVAGGAIAALVRDETVQPPRRLRLLVCP
jgi:hypothetical protein